MTISDPPIRLRAYPKEARTRISDEMHSGLLRMALDLHLSEPDLIRKILSEGLERHRAHRTTSGMKRSETVRVRD